MRAILLAILANVLTDDTVQASLTAVQPHSTDRGYRTASRLDLAACALLAALCGIALFMLAGCSPSFDTFGSGVAHMPRATSYTPPPAPLYHHFPRLHAPRAASHH